MLDDGVEPFGIEEWGKLGAKRDQIAVRRVFLSFFLFLRFYLLSRGFIFYARHARTRNVRTVRGICGNQRTLSTLPFTICGPAALGLLVNLEPAFHVLDRLQDGVVGHAGGEHVL